MTIEDANNLVNTTIEQVNDSFLGKGDPEYQFRGVQLLVDCLAQLEPSLSDAHFRHGPLQNLLRQVGGHPLLAMDLCKRALASCEQLQVRQETYIHRGLILFHMWSLAKAMGNEWDKRRLALLTLIEDFFRAKQGNVDFHPSQSGGFVSFQLDFGWTEEQLNTFRTDAERWLEGKPQKVWWSELALESLSNKNHLVSSFQNSVNADQPPRIAPNATMLTQLVDHKMDLELNLSRGKSLELFASLVFGSIPGVRTYRDYQSAHQIDVLLDCASNEQFRQRFGNLMLVECKDWQKPVEITAISKFAATISLVGATTGVIFSKQGITGEPHIENATKVVAASWTRLGINILILRSSDLDQIIGGVNIGELLTIKKLDNQMLAAGADSRLS